MKISPVILSAAYLLGTWGEPPRVDYLFKFSLHRLKSLKISRSFRGQGDCNGSAIVCHAYMVILGRIIAYDIAHCLYHWQHCTKGYP